MCSFPNTTPLPSLPPSLPPSLSSSLPPVAVRVRGLGGGQPWRRGYECELCVVRVRGRVRVYVDIHSHAQIYRIFLCR
jgi:hypothetical protein